LLSSLDIQKKCVVSNPEYVANPPKVRFIIEGEVDITLVDATGKELNMGTSFDFFWNRSES
jgi:D-alanyl-D-alanine dipeptidase